MLGSLKQWCTESTKVVSFKLETDQDLVIKKAKQSLELYKVDLVVANRLDTIREECVLVLSQENQKLLKVEKSQDLEQLIVEGVLMQLNF